MPNVQTRTQHVLTHLDSRLRLLQTPSSQSLSHVITFLAEQQEMQPDVDTLSGLKRAAEYVVSTMNIHMLNLLAIFKEKAQQEGISLRDREDTLSETYPEFMRVMQEVSARLSVQSLDDLAALINITTRLQVLSRTDSADEAQNWLYELPAMYARQLTNEGLLVHIYSSLESGPVGPVDWSRYTTP